jgi:hypothetical protein
VRSRSQKPLLQVLSKSVIDRERDNEGCDTSGNASDGNSSDDPNECLPPFGAQISGCDEEFEAH